MVKAGFDGIAADMLPLVSGCDGQVSLVLPGSSIKGVFRSQAERIVQTVLGDVRPNWLGREEQKKFLDAVKLPLINELFGAAKQTDSQPHVGLGTLSVIDCIGQHRLTVDQWRDIHAATDDRQLRKALDEASLQPWSEAYHVAIDRWLGSAAESMLHTVLEPHRTEWEPLTLEVDLQRLPNDLQLPAMALLLLVLRDLANIRLPLGFATHRGMETVSVERVEMVGVRLPKPLEPLGRARLAGGRMNELPANLRQAMNQAWQQCVTQNEEVPA